MPRFFFLRRRFMHLHSLLVPTVPAALNIAKVPRTRALGCDVRRSATKLSLCMPLVAFASVFFSATAQARNVEPRKSYQIATIPLQWVDTPEQAFQVYKDWQASINNGAYHMTLLDFFVKPGEIIVNGTPTQYYFHYQMPVDYPVVHEGHMTSQVMDCPVGWTATEIAISPGIYKYTCTLAVAPEPACPSCGNPIFPATGLKKQVEVDYQGSGATALRFARTYRSDRNGWSNSYESMGINFPTIQSALVAQNLPWPDRACLPGIGHQSFQSYCFRYIANVDSAGLPLPNDFALQRSGNRMLDFGSATTLLPAADINDRVTPVNGSGVITGYNVYNASNEATEFYDTTGRLLTITERNGQVQTLAYSSAATPPVIAPRPGMLIGVSDAFGHQLAFTYNSARQMTSMTDPSGGVYAYAYDEPSSVVLVGQQPAGNLTSVTYPDGRKRTYWYNEQAKTANKNLPFALTGITDEDGVRFATWNYDVQGRAISSEHANGLEKVTVSFPSSTQRTTVDASGASRTYHFQTILGVSKPISESQPNGSGGTASSTTTYDGNSNVATKTDFNGRVTKYNTYDLSRNLETSRTEAFGTPRARTITTQWHPVYRSPIQIDEPGKRTTITYDVKGNVLTQTVFDTSTSVSRTSTYTYNTLGQTLTVDGPRTDSSDLSTLTYYGCTTGFQCGQLATVTNGMGQVTQYLTYNAHGQPLTMLDANNVLTTLTYDTRQRLTSRTVANEVTNFEYWPTGLLKKVMLPNNTYISYIYDDAHRLVGIRDSEGNATNYTLDSAGNRMKEETFDPSNALSVTRANVFDVLGRLSKTLGAASTPAVTTTFGYDNNGNQTTVNAPLGRNSTNAYDELNRLKQVTDPNGGITQYDYNALDQLISVTDPRNLQTIYTYNALGDLMTQVNPDTGTTTNTFDSGGNLKTSTDARNKTATYTYDALNRVTQVAYGDQTITYGYDAGTNGKGRLTSTSDSGHSMSWAYDAHGRVTSKTQTVGAVAKTVGYGYANGQLTTLTTPSNQAVAYVYTQGKVTGISVNGTSLLNNVLYEPFGPSKGWTWGNGTIAVRTYDSDGKLTQLDSAGLNTYSYDDAFRILGITDTTNAANNWSYGYDNVDRLSSATRSGFTQGFTYDADGNRLTQTGPGLTKTATVTSTLTYPATSNKLTSVTGAPSTTYSYDAAGNTLSDGTIVYTYYNNGRMKTARNGAAAATVTYTYNALGQRVKKTGTTRFFVYDEAGHLQGEYDSGGTMLQEFVWLGETPVAVLTPKRAGVNSAGVNIFYIHTDHLNTPRKITRPSDNQLRWTWNPDAFGNGAPNENPSGLGVFTYNQRFPGQYFDTETGLHQNYFRDYDPQTGRYVESDPIGLMGGVNTYGYVGGNPVSMTDPEALAYYCTQPLHAFPAGDLGGFGPLHHGFVCNDQGVCGSQDRVGNPLVSPGRPSEGDDFSRAKETGRCEHTETNQCENTCIADEVLSTRRPTYTVIPGGPLSRASGVIGRLLGTAGTIQNCQDWAKSTITYCKIKCAASRIRPHFPDPDARSEP